jgi:tripartite-type tricarboxylate transporter receptor subunit TctC
MTHSQNFITRRHLVLAVLATGSASALAQSSAWPAKPIRFITPYPPGSTPDTLIRLIGPKLTEALGQPIVVDNRPGGNTIIGGEAVVRAAPDGYTLMSTVMSHVLTPSLMQMPYDAIKDFQAIATLSAAEQMLVVHSGLPANNLQEFIAYAKARPGQINYASVGTGGATHIIAEMFSQTAGISMKQIPYKGSVPALTDLMGGQVQVFFAIPSSVVGHIQGGRVKPIAVSGTKRLAAFPQVPTFSEAGLTGFDVKTWFGVMGPTGIPRDVIDKLSTTINRILAQPDIREKMASQGVEPFLTSPDEFSALMRTDMARFAAVIKQANIKMEN